METNKIVDALILGGVLVVSLGSQTAIAAAASACSDGTYIQQGFTPKCSAGVYVSVNDATATTAGVKGMSKKGMHNFGGDVVGGNVKACETTSVAYSAPSASTTGC